MGSGHFLVEAVDFITDKMIDFLNGFPWNPVMATLRETRETILKAMEKQNITIDEPRLNDLNLLKRHVLKRCIYGVDLNPMAVELAKVSLWLDCFTLGAPLSFLDHHLKCGNSLIGATVAEVKEAVEPVSHQISKSKVAASAKEWKEVETVSNQVTLFGSRFAGLMLATDLMRHVGELSDVTATQVKESRAEYRKASDTLAPFKRILDIYVSQWFGNNGGSKGKKKKTAISPAIDFLRSKEAETLISAKNINKVLDKLSEGDRKIAENAINTASEKKFFHWELEFPEVFYGKGREKENPGFDAVVGNPPYITVGAEDRDDQDFFRLLYESAVYKTNTYLLIYEKALKQLLAKGRIIGFIIPNAILSNSFLSSVRRFLYEKCAIVQINDNAFKVFPEAEMGGTIELLARRIEIAEIHGSRIKICVTYSPEDFLRINPLCNVIEQSSYTFPPNYYFFTREPSKSRFIEAFKSLPVKLGETCELKNGFNPGNVKDFLILKKYKDSKSKPMITGRHIERYEIDWEGWFVNYDPDLGCKLSLDDTRGKSGMPLQKKIDFALRTPEIFEREKLVIRKTGDSLICAIDQEKMYHDTLVHNLVSKDKTISLFFMLALLNSKAVNKIYQSLSQKEGSVFTKIDLADLEQLPLHRLSFTTPAGKRKELLGQACQLYENYKMRNSPVEILEFVNILFLRRLESIDVVHDLLAYLAEQMTNLNKQKLTEVRQLLSWLAKELKIQPDNKGNTGIDALAGKSTIKSYLGDYQKNEDALPLDSLMDILHKNRSHIGMSLSDNRFVSKLRDEYEKSLAILLPIKEKLRMTDWLIDQIVYKLYGLAAEEIKIVEAKE
jgi:hypothetical protein